MKTVEDKTPAEPVEQTVNGQEETVEVYKPVIKKLSGLTVVGKIELPAEEKKSLPASSLLRLMILNSDVGRKERELPRKKNRLLWLSPFSPTEGKSPARKFRERDLSGLKSMRKRFRNK